MNNLADLNRFAASFKDQSKLMPVLFIGHGSPMNGIENNEFSNRWKELAIEIPRPKAVLVVSAHWFTNGTFITAMDNPPTIHDFYGFPKELENTVYPAPGDPVLAAETAKLLSPVQVGLDHDWGLDHGAWTVVKHMFPEADIPVLQLSIDYSKGPRYHYDLAGQLSVLRKKGVLILGSGNMVHNLRMISWPMINGGGYDWALDLNEQFKKLISSKTHAPLIDYEKLGHAGNLAIPTPEHYLPLLYSLGLQKDSDEISFFNDKAVGGSLTMTSVKLG
ncbi:4,5-DOPA dioxygenase extradiol [Pedobacter sp. HMF7647]|uniref:4,5-DOPA dioxygenase extradiol n=1 Tax=Hufsiella arboris TaxID=2695275 RepID=A0A7K1YDB7_9SPHI|nr:4,5-DOPA dioxygenase extradiol [Hufsiella arboris]MXV52584.1 4,5-DOPA dioxygenase extradiol [Hufsiella arboris]